MDNVANVVSIFYGGEVLTTPASANVGIPQRTVHGARTVVYDGTRDQRGRILDRQARELQNIRGVITELTDEVVRQNHKIESLETNSCLLKTAIVIQNKELQYATYKTNRLGVKILQSKLNDLDKNANASFAACGGVTIVNAPAGISLSLGAFAWHISYVPTIWKIRDDKQNLENKVADQEKKFPEFKARFEEEAKTDLSLQ